jgi:hypothetical protein
VNDLAVLLVALGLDLTLEILDPRVAPVLLFPDVVLARLNMKRVENILVSIEGILDFDALGSHGLVKDRSTGLADLRLGAVLSRLSVVAASERCHQLVAVESLEVDSRDISVVESRSAADTTIVFAVGAVEHATSTAGVSTATASSTESRALVRLRLLGEGTEEVGG